MVSQAVSDVGSGAKPFETLLAQSPGNPFSTICTVNIDFAAPSQPELSTLPNSRPGDRDFVVRVIAAGPLANTASNPASCGTVGDLWFYIGGNSVAPQQPLQIGQDSRDAIGRILLNGAVAQPRLDFSSPELAIGLVGDFDAGPPRAAAGRYRFIDTAQMPGSFTAVIVGQVNFNLVRP